MARRKIVADSHRSEAAIVFAVWPRRRDFVAPHSG